jgi:D-arabinose 1-dehydrogenase-like Zn-dependent alcohol dehydrogenase
LLFHDVGGLGHFGVQWAKAMGAKVIGISHNDKKREIAKELGCHEYLDTSDQEAMASYRKKMTHILCTGAGQDFEWATYLSLIKANGHFMNVNLPDWSYPALHPGLLVMSQVFISGSIVGSPAEIEEM